MAIKRAAQATRGGCKPAAAHKRMGAPVMPKQKSGCLTTSTRVEPRKAVIFVPDSVDKMTLFLYGGEHEEQINGAHCGAL